MNKYFLLIILTFGLISCSRENTYNVKRSFMEGMKENYFLPKEGYEGNIPFSDIGISKRAYLIGNKYYYGLKINNEISNYLRYEKGDLYLFQYNHSIFGSRCFGSEQLLFHFWAAPNTKWQVNLGEDIVEIELKGKGYNTSFKDSVYGFNLSNIKSEGTLVKESRTNYTILIGKHIGLIQFVELKDEYQYVISLIPGVSIIKNEYPKTY